MRVRVRVSRLAGADELPYISPISPYISPSRLAGADELPYISPTSPYISPSRLAGADELLERVQHEVLVRRPGEG